MGQGSDLGNDQGGDFSGRRMTPVAFVLSFPFLVLMKTSGGSCVIIYHCKLFLPMNKEVVKLLYSLIHLPATGTPSLFSPKTFYSALLCPLLSC